VKRKHKKIPRSEFSVTVSHRLLGGDPITVRRHYEAGFYLRHDSTCPQFLRLYSLSLTFYTLQQ